MSSAPNRKNWFLRHKVMSAMLAAFVLLGIARCGADDTTTAALIPVAAPVDATTGTSTQPSAKTTQTPTQSAAEKRAEEAKKRAAAKKAAAKKAAAKKAAAKRRAQQREDAKNTFANCTDMNNTYAHGVGRPGARDQSSGPRVTNFKVSRHIYDLNSDSDRDGDGIACEKR